MKRFRKEERRGDVPPALPVKMEHRLQVQLEPLGVRGEPVRQPPELGQLAREAPHLLAKVAPALLQELVPGVVSEAEYRAGLPVQGPSTCHLPELLVPRNMLGEQHEARQRYGPYCLFDRCGGRRLGQRC